MPKKKNIKNKLKKNNSKKNNGLAKIASITTKSISSAFVNFKKKQELKKIKEIKLKKLQENNNLIKEKKELKILEDKLKKEDNKLRLKEDELRIKEKELKSKEDQQKIEKERLIKKDENLILLTNDLRNKEKELKLKKEEQNRKEIDLKVREEEYKARELKELRKKQKEERLKQEEENRQKDFEAQRIKAWEEKFDEEQRLKEEEIVKKFYSDETPEKEKNQNEDNLETKINNLISLGNRISFHNYYPRPKNDFDLNLGSQDPEILNFSRKHCLFAIELASKLNIEYYSIHAGFCIDPLPENLGRDVGGFQVKSYEKVKETFLNELYDLASFSSKNNVKLMVENNVTSKSTFKKYNGQKVLLMSDLEDTIDLIMK